jgi:hypothetical protein
LTQKLAEAIDMFDKFEDDDKLFSVLIEEWKAPDQRKPKRTEYKEGED